MTERLSDKEIEGLIALLEEADAASWHDEDAIAALGDDVAIAARALRQLMAERRWRPIEEAPKDGREVLLYLGEPWSKIEKARWYEPWQNWQAEGIPADPVREEIHGIGSAIPTHFMELPASPKGETP